MKKRVVLLTIGFSFILCVCKSQKVKDTLGKNIEINTKTVTDKNNRRFLIVTVVNKSCDTLSFNFDAREFYDNEWWYSEYLTPMFDPRFKGRNYPTLPYEFDSTRKAVLKYEIIKGGTSKNLVKIRFIFRQNSNIDDVYAIKYSKPIALRKIKAYFQ